MNTAPDLSIIIVSFNARGHLDRCLQSLHFAPPARTYETIVVDNASTDGSAEAARRWSGVRVIDAGANVGFAAANNIGIRSSSGRNLLLLNCDTLVPPGAVDNLLAMLEAEPSVAVVGPRLVDGKGRPELSFGSMVNPWNEFRQKVLRPWLTGRLTRRQRLPDWVTGACLMVRRTDAEAVGLLDERYFMYFEDVDFCAAIRARGQRILFTPSVQVTHLRGRSRATALRATKRAYRRSQIAFYEKHHPDWVPFLRLYLMVRLADI
jgi:N-acetylglucosaminyl-diphospho-decaprenol L-rhamnosyltransferase